MTIILSAGNGAQPWWSYADDFTGRGAQLRGPYGREERWNVVTHQGFRDPVKHHWFHSRDQAEALIRQWLGGDVEFERHWTEVEPDNLRSKVK